MFLKKKSEKYLERPKPLSTAEEKIGMNFPSENCKLPETSRNYFRHKDELDKHTVVREKD